MRVPTLIRVLTALAWLAALASACSTFRKGNDDEPSFGKQMAEGEAADDELALGLDEEGAATEEPISEGSDPAVEDFLQDPTKESDEKLAEGTAPAPIDTPVDMSEASAESIASGSDIPLADLENSESDRFIDKLAAEAAQSSGLPMDAGVVQPPADPSSIAPAAAPPMPTQVPSTMQNAAMTQVAPTAQASTAGAAVANVTKNPATELQASSAILKWVGYRFEEGKGTLTVEMDTTLPVDYEVFPALDRRREQGFLFRFHQARLSKRLKYALDSSEFCSPISTISMKQNVGDAYVDVFIKHNPKFKDYADRGQLWDGRMAAPGSGLDRGAVRLVFNLPKCEQADRPAPQVADGRAVSLVPGESAPLARFALQTNQGAPRVGLARNKSLRIGPTVSIREYIRGQQGLQVDKKGLPESFDRRKSSHVEHFKVSLRLTRKHFMGVAADRLVPRPKAKIASGAKQKPMVLAQAENGAANEAAESNIEALMDDASATGNGTGEAPAAEVPQEANPAQVPQEANAMQAPVEANAAAGVDIAPPSAAEIPQNVAPAQNEVPEPVATPAESTGSMMPASDVEGAPTAGSAPSRFGGRAIRLDYYDAPLSLILSSLKEQTGYTYIYPEAVGQLKVTVHFDNVPWDEALTAILETYGLGIVPIGQNIIRVDQITELSKSMRERDDALRLSSTQVLVYSLNNAVGKDVKTRLEELLAGPGVKITQDDRTNKLVIEAPKQIIAKASEIIKRLDTETRQVEIASRIVEVQKSQANAFGISWLNNLNFDPGRALGFGTLNFPNSVGSSFAVDPGVTALNAAGVGRFRIGSLNRFLDLDLLLKLEEKKGTTNVLQSNRVMVLDGQQAKILAGSSKFFKPNAGNGLPIGGGAAGPAAGLAEIRFDLKLEVTPQVTAMNAVIMKLRITSDTPGDPAGEVIASKSTRELETQMVRNSGDTGVIGGIYDTVRTTSVTGVPFLSDIPILGALFRSTTSKENQTELLIMVTPSIVPVDRGSQEPTADNTTLFDSKNPKDVLSKSITNPQGEVAY